MNACSAPAPTCPSRMASSVSSKGCALWGIGFGGPRPLFAARSTLVPRTDARGALAPSALPAPTPTLTPLPPILSLEVDPLSPPITAPPHIYILGAAAMRGGAPAMGTGSRGDDH